MGARWRPLAPPVAEIEQHYTPAEVAARLRVSRRTVARLIAGVRPKLASVRIGRQVRIAGSVVDRFLREHGSTRPA